MTDTVSEYLDFKGKAPEEARETGVTAVEDLTAAWDLQLDQYFEPGEGIKTYTAPSNVLLGERPSSGYRAVRIPARPDTDKKQSIVYEEFGETLSHEPVGGRPCETYTDLVIGEMFGALARHVAPTGRIDSGIENPPRVELIAENLYAHEQVERILQYDTVLAELESDFEALAAEEDPEAQVEAARDILERLREEVPTEFDPDPEHPPSLTTLYLDEFNVALQSVGRDLHRQIQNGEITRPEIYSGTIADFRRRYESGMASTERADIEATRRKQIQEHLAREGVFGGHYVGGKLAQHLLDEGEEPSVLVRMTTDELLDEYGGFVDEIHRTCGITDKLIEEYFRPQLLLQADKGFHPDDHPAWQRNA